MWYIIKLYNKFLEKIWVNQKQKTAVRGMKEFEEIEESI